MQEGQPQIDASSYTCMQCGYDLSGSAVGSTCPECGTPVSQSLRTQENNSSNSSMAVIALVLSLVGISVCPPVGAFAILAYYAAKKDMAFGRADPGSMGMAKTGLVIGWICLVLTLVGGALIMLIVVSGL